MIKIEIEMLTKIRLIEKELLKNKSISDIEKTSIYTNLIEDNIDVLSIIRNRSVYKIMIASCWWPYLNPGNDANLLTPEEVGKNTSEAIKEDLPKYLSDDEHVASLKAYEDGVVELFISPLFKLLSITTKSMYFPTNPITVWVNYVHTCITDNDLTQLIYADGYGGAQSITTLADVISSLSTLKPKLCLSDETIIKLEAITDSPFNFQVCNKNEIKLINSIYLSLGLGLDRYIQNNRTWTDNLINFTETSKVSDDLEILLFHFSKATFKLPSNAWIKKLEEICKNISKKEFNEFYQNITDSITNDILADIPFSSLYNETIVKGLVFSTSIIKDFQNPDSTLKLAQFSFKKVPHYGVNSLEISKACIYSLKQANRDKSTYSIFKLLGLFNKKKVKLNNYLLKELESAIKYLEIQNSLSRTELEELAMKLNKNTKD